MSGDDADEAILGIEERAFNAWPALATVLAGGWVLRFADGFTKRANSVNALAPTVDAAAMAAIARPIYASRGLPLIFRLSPLAGKDADRLLADLGAARVDETLVMRLALDRQLVRDADVRIDSVPSPHWSAGFAAANRVPENRRALHDRVLAAICWPTAFAALERDGTAIAWGLAVAERGMVGLFDIVTAPEARRQGAARRLVTALMAWGSEAGAVDAYLQVVATNTPAIRLYESLGFQEAYRYHYRVFPG